ncbi:MAG: C/D box methylation guide ribonucleoprotein complex aNOP56 subunit [Candidatus Bathyarchaeia archaeon]
MEGIISLTPIGIFAIDGDGNVIAWEGFPKDPKAVSEILRGAGEGRLEGPLRGFLEGLRKSGFDAMVFESEPLAEAARRALGIAARAEAKSKALEAFKARLPAMAVELGLFPDEAGYSSFAREVMLEMARASLALAGRRRDVYAIQIVRAMDDLDKTINLFSGRLREWFGLHFPELDKEVEKHETYARLVHDLGRRENFEFERLIERGLPEDRARRLDELAKNSVGADIGDEDLERIRDFSAAILEAFKLRDRMAKYLDEIMPKIAPNLCAIVGPSLSARLISLAGGLESLAKMPASTIQVLGAEKALFRSLRTGSRPPKHGVIFQYGPIHESPRWQRGKIARALAGKLSIAARLDAFGGEPMGEALKEGLNRRIEEIRQKYASPPARIGRARDRSAPARKARRRLPRKA